MKCGKIESGTKAICFYHTDLDGICSAAIVKYVCPEIELRGINYGNPFPWDDIQDATVIMVDFSLQPHEDMTRLAKEAKHFTWIDHHATALEHDDGGITGLRRNGEAGCELTWDFFMGGQRPWAITALGRWDVWDHSDPRFNHFQFGMREKDYDPNDSERWKALFRTDIFANTVIDGICKIGKGIVNYTSIEFASMVKSYGFVTRLEGLKVLACNCAFKGGSKIFESVWDEEKYDAVLVYRWSPKGGNYTASIYTDKEGVDVGAVAKTLGGGGHVGAAGFAFTEFPFPVTEIPV